MTWGANTTDASCTKCHGKGTALANYSTTNAWQAAPGYAGTGTDINGQAGTFTNGVSNDAQVGAHDAHLRTINNYSDRKILCTDCHAIPGTANHANGATDYAWSNLAKNIGTTTSDRGALNPGYATGTCSANYCHGGVLNGGSDTTPVWNDTAYLASYTKDATACGKCHGAPPTSGATLGYDHNGYTIASGCTGCHGHEGNGPNHIDGNLQATGGACNACHSYDTVGGSWGSGTHLDGAVAEGWGAHAQHIEHLKTLRGISLDANTDTYGSASFNAVCGVCHDRSPYYHTLDNSSARMINISTAYQTGASAPSYLGVSGTSSSVNPKTCSNIACHFNATPRWQ
jgi:predicted CxxxxCH...CXXCH cytochrome family protein